MDKEKKSITDSSRYFEELLLRIRDIRSSERSAMQKITDVIVSAADYDGSNSLRCFFWLCKAIK